MDLTVPLTALAFGALTAVALPLGAALGVVWRPRDRTLAVLLAFGGGALLAALMLDLVAPGVDRGHHAELIGGCVVGGVLFKALDWAVNRRGGYLRKASTAMTYWKGRAAQKVDTILRQVNGAEPLRAAPPDVKDLLLSMMSVRDVTAGSWLYREGDPPAHFFIVDSGAVELVDTDGTSTALGARDAFGFMSFLTGLPRDTGARIAADARVLVVPRDRFMDELADSPALVGTLRSLIHGMPVEEFLRDRHGLTPTQVQAWLDSVEECLVDGDEYEPPRPDAGVDTDRIVAALRADHMAGFFSPLSDHALRRIAARMRPRRMPRGSTWFTAGERSDEMAVITSGSVYVLYPGVAEKETTFCEPDECVGVMSFITEGIHTATAVAASDTEAYVLTADDFDDVVEELDEVRSREAEFLRSEPVVAYLTTQHAMEPQRAAEWMTKAAHSVEGRGAFPSLAEVTQTVAAHKGAAMAMFLGILLDGIPESFVIGAHVLNNGGITLSLLGGLFLANFPEALSSASGMVEQGLSRARILWMWTAIMVITGVGAAFGAVVLADAPDPLFTLIEGVAAGAMLTMIAETMLPEAYHKGGGVVGLATLAGFLAAIWSASYH